MLLKSEIIKYFVFQTKYYLHLINNKNKPQQQSSYKKRATCKASSNVKNKKHAVKLFKENLHMMQVRQKHSFDVRNMLTINYKLVNAEVEIYYTANP